MVLAFLPGKVLLQDALNSIDVFGLNRCKYCDGWDEPREKEGKPRAGRWRSDERIGVKRVEVSVRWHGVRFVCWGSVCQLRNVSIYTFLSCIQVIILEQLRTLFPLLFCLALLIMLRLRFSCWLLLLPIFDMHSNRDETRQNVRCILWETIISINDRVSRLGCSTLPP